MSYSILKLENQLCFPVYAASRLIIREYQPHLDRLGITYPQYLVLMILWEQDFIGVNDIAKRLILNTNTITPLLKRMELQGLLKRERSKEDERKVIVCLSVEGRALEEEAKEVPKSLMQELLQGPLDLDDLIRLKSDLGEIIEHLSAKK